MQPRRLKPFLHHLSPLLFAATVCAAQQPGVKQLDAYTLTAVPETTLLPAPDSAHGVFPQSADLRELPRAATLLPANLRADLGQEGYGNLYLSGAGTARPDYLGIAGTPYLRGDDAGLYFAGMQRAYQLLAFPRSTNATDTLVIVRGPAPAHFGPTPGGGYVNELPKHPDNNQRLLNVGADSNGHFNTAIDFSGQNTTNRYRFSLETQRGDGYFRNQRDERRSFYAAVEHTLGAAQIFHALELYQWEGNENPGWNRLTQDLIDHGHYLADSGTKDLGTDHVLIAPEDFARATDALYYLEAHLERAPESQLQNQLFIEYFEADKQSPSNDFAFADKALAIEEKFSLTHAFELFKRPTELVWGTSVRFTQVDERFGLSPDLDAVAQADLSQDAGGSAPPAFNLIKQMDLLQGALFASARTHWHNRFETYLSARLGAHHFDTEAANARRGQKNTFNVELAPVLRLTPEHHLYGSLQHGTALIPGEGGSVTSETNFGETELYEIGLKSELLDATLFNTLALYYWDKSAFESRTSSAEAFRAQGFEWELTWQPSSRFYLLGAFNAQRTWRRGGPPERLAPYDASTIPQHDYLPAGSPLPNNPDTIVPGTPEVQAKLYAVVTTPSGWRLGGGPLWSDGFFSSYDHYFRIPSSLVFNGFLDYEHNDWRISLHGENLTDERYFTGSDPNFFGNALLTPASGRTFRLSLTRAF